MVGFDLFVMVLLLYGLVFLIVAALRRPTAATAEVPGDADSAITAERRAFGDDDSADESAGEVREPAARNGKAGLSLRS
jgi:hypothetical protein